MALVITNANIKETFLGTKNANNYQLVLDSTNAVLSAHANLVAYSTAQKGAGNAYGLCMYWCNNSTYSDMSVYTITQTIFTTWRSINNTYGTH